MADLTISGVGELTTTSGSVIATTTSQGIAGTSISPGQALYADPTSNNQLFPAKANDSFQASHIVGIALTTAAAKQPVIYAISGDITLSNTSAVISGTVYVLSGTNAGGIAPITDSPTYVAVLGVGNGGTSSGGTNNFRLGLIAAPSLTGTPMVFPSSNLSSNSSQSTATNNATCTGRLTLTTLTPVTTTDVTGATTLYFTPYEGNQIALYNGSVWQTIPFSETSLSLSSLLANMPYDIFGYNNGGLLTLEAIPWTAPNSGSITAATNANPIVVTYTGTDPANDQVVTIAGVLGNTAANGTWRVTSINTGTKQFTLNTLAGGTSIGNGAMSGSPTWQRADQNTARATNLVTQDGVYVKSGTTSHRYLGTIRTTTTAGQCEDSLLRRFVWNYYNQQPRELYVKDSTIHTYNSSTERPWHNDEADRIQFVLGQSVPTLISIVGAVASGASGSAYISTALNAVSGLDLHVGFIVNDDTQYVGGGASGANSTISGGYNFYQAIEAADVHVASYTQVQLKGVIYA